MPAKLTPPLRLTPLLALPLAVSCTEPAEPSGKVALGSQSSALNGVEGTFEYALDAPWRIEPNMVGTTGDYGSIPITVAIFDEYVIREDADQEVALAQFATLR